MPATTAAAFIDLVDGRRGHFRLESGHHSRLWLDLDPLFTDARRVAPFVDALVARLRSHDVSAVCGPMLGGAFLAQQTAAALGVEFLYAERCVPHDADGLYQIRYSLPAALRGRVRDRRIAMVDDVMSAGSALRGTYTGLLEHGAVPVVAGALLLLGSTGESFFAERRIPVEAVARDEFDLWTADTCPLCAGGMQLEDVAELS